MNLLAIDDNSLVLIGLEKLLSECGWQLTVATHVQQALATYDHTPFDVVLLELALPPESGESRDPAYGCELLHRLTQRHPHTHSLVLSHLDWREVPRYLYFADMMGARGFFSKNVDSPDAITEALIALRNEGESDVYSRTQCRLLRHFERERPYLSSREREVLRELAQGLIQKEIAYKLGLAPSTIKSHLDSVYQKLQVSDAYQAIEQARYWGFLENGWLAHK